MTDKQRDNAMLVMLECISDAYEILGSYELLSSLRFPKEAADTINYRKNVVSELGKIIREEIVND